MSMKSMRSGISDASADDGAGQGLTNVGVYKGNRVALKMVNYGLPLLLTKDDLMELQMVKHPLMSFLWFVSLKHSQLIFVFCTVIIHTDSKHILSAKFHNY